MDSGDDEFEEETWGDRAAAKPGRLERIRGSVQSANIEPGKSDVSTKWAIDRLDEPQSRLLKESSPWNVPASPAHRSRSHGWL